MTSSIDRILLPLEAVGDQPHLLRSATVFSSWFDAPLQIVCADADTLPRFQVLAGSLGVPIEPVLHFEEPFAAGVAAHAHSHGPCIIVSEPSALGLALVAESTQAVFLTANSGRARMSVGPLALEVTGSASDVDAMALAAVLSPILHEPVRLVVRPDADAQAKAAAGEARLRQLGCEVGIDQIAGTDLPPLVVAGRTRGATAIIVPSDRLGEPGLIEAAISQEVSIFVAPATDSAAGRTPPFTLDLTRPPDRTPPGARLDILSREESLARLDRHSVARIGYVEDGWPVILPVNYRLHNGDVFIRSLAGGKVRAAERGDVVCLELDGFDTALRTGWSVVAHGPLEVIGDPAVLNEAWANDPEPWIASEDWRWLRMVPISVTGREVWPTVEQ